MTVCAKFLEDSVKGGTINITDGNLKVSAVSITTLDPDTIQFYSEVTNVVGGPVALAGVTVTGRVVKANAFSLASAPSGTVRAFVYWYSTGNNATSRVVAIVLDGPYTGQDYAAPAAGNFQL